MNRDDWFASKRPHIAPGKYPYHKKGYRWAMANVNAGNAAKRKNWPPSHRIVSNGRKFLFRKGRSRKEYRPTPVDVLSDDWIII